MTANLVLYLLFKDYYRIILLLSGVYISFRYALYIPFRYGCTFLSDIGCTFVADTGCTFHSATGCTFVPLYSANIGGGSFSGHYSGTITGDNDHVLHNYFVSISTYDIKQPIILFEIGTDQIKTKEIDEILKIIEKRNTINKG